MGSGPDATSLMIQYRPFQNTDPPKLVSLWHACRLGRGAAEGFSSDAFETVLFAQPYFDPRGLIVACEGDEVVGFTHAGFGPSEDETGLSPATGVICAVLVHPDYRRQGIGRELVSRAERYLIETPADEIATLNPPSIASATAAEPTSGQETRTILAGPAGRDTPFYVGLYGGSRPDGFLESDENAGPFLRTLGYEPRERYFVFQKQLQEQADPMHFRLASIRRKMQLAILDQPEHPSWWWLTRFGRLDSIHCLLVPKNGHQAIAEVTAHGLDLYVRKWESRAVGLTDLHVVASERRQGYAQALLIEVSRRLRQELVGVLEAHAHESDEAAIGVLESAGFERVDTGVVYQRPAGGHESSG